MSIVSACGAISSARPPVAIDRRRLADLGAHAPDDPVHLAGEAVDHSRLEAGDRRLADHGRRRGEVHLHQPRRAGEERLHRDLDPGGEDAADVLPVGGDDVEVRGRPEVDDDARRAVALACRNGVGDAIGADLAGVVVDDRDAGLRARPEDEERRLRVVARRTPRRRGQAAGPWRRGRRRRCRRNRDRAARAAARRPRRARRRCARPRWRRASALPAGRRRTARGPSACCRRRRPAAPSDLA